MQKTLSGSLSAVLIASLAGFCLVPQQVLAQAAPSCANGLVEQPEQFIGEEFTFDITLANSGQPGFAPFAEVSLPPGVSFTSGAYSGVNANATATIVTDDDGGYPSTGTVENPATGEILTLPIGVTYVFLEYPIGSHTVGQGDAIMEVTAFVDALTPIGTALTPAIGARCGYGLGSDPSDNPNTDAPLTTSWSNVPLVPTMIRPFKLYETVEGEGDFGTDPETSEAFFANNGETATGPDYPITYTVGADIANTAEATSITITDTIPANFQLTSIDSVGDDGNGFSITFTPTGGTAQTSSSVPFVPTGGFGPGGLIEVTINSVTGTTQETEAQVQFIGFIPDVDADGNPILDTAGNEGSGTIDNDATVNATYDGTPVGGQTNETSIAPLNLNMQKQVRQISNQGPDSWSPSDQLEYFLDVQLSDYSSLDDVVIEDVLPDGLSYLAGTATLEIVQGGVTTAYPLTEALVAETDTLGGSAPPYDFANCGGCTVAVTTDTTNDDDANVPPNDGETVVFFDISQAIINAGGSGALTGIVGGDDAVHIRFNAEINETFINTKANDGSIDALDRLTNTATITGIGPESTYIAETDSVSIWVESPRFTKSITAFSNAGGLDVAPFAVAEPLSISPGDTVTYSLTVEVPSGDLENMIITDFLPIPFFDAMTVTSFDTGSTTSPFSPVDGSASSVPAIGTIGWGDNTTGMTGTLPVPALSQNATENSFMLTFDTIEEMPSDGVTLELLFTVQASSQPFADGLILANQGMFQVSNSDEPILTESEFVSIRSQFPELALTKGVLSVDNADATLTPDVTSPGLAAAFTVDELTAAPIDSNAEDTDAGDRVTFAIAVPNSGHSYAYDITIEDAMPAGFVVPTSAADLNLVVRDAAGNDLSSSAIGGLFGFAPVGGTSNGTNTALVVNTGIPGLDYDPAGPFQTADGQANEGANILLVTYELVVDDAAQIDQTLTNMAGISFFTGAIGGPNYVAEPELYEDDATVEYPLASMTKTIAEATDGQAHTTSPQATIGEVVQYDLAITLPEGQTGPFTLTDNVPAGMAYVLGSFVTDPACVYGGTAPTLTVTPTGTGTAADGENIVITGTGYATTGDNDTTNNVVCYTYDAVVLDASASDGDTLTNSATLEYGTKTTTPATADVQIVEPDIEIDKSVTPSGQVDAGDIVTYTLVVAHSASSTADGFDLAISDVVPAGLSALVDFATDGLDNNGDGAIDDPAEATAGFFAAPDTFAWNFDSLPLGETRTLQFRAQLGVATSPGTTIVNEANVEYDTILGDDPNERDSNDSDTADIETTGVGLTKELISTSHAHTNDAQHDGNREDLAVGESATFTITALVPEGTMTNFKIRDIVQDGLRIDTAVVTQDDTGAGPPSISINATETRANFDWPLIVNPAGDGLKTIILTVEVTALNDVTNIVDGTDRRNRGRVTYDELDGSVNSDVRMDIVEPVLEITKTANPVTAEAGDQIVYTLSVAHTADSTADAFNLAITDAIDTANLTVNTAFGSDGIDNDADGTVDEADEATAVLFDTGTGTLTWNETTAGAAFAGLPVGDTLTWQFAASPTVTVEPLQVIKNQATLAWSTLPAAADADERAYSDQDSINITIDAISVQKTIESTSLSDTAADQHTALNDVAIGESVTYHLQVTIPAGTISGLVVTDTAPAGMTPVASGVVSADGMTHDCNSGAITGQVTTFACGTVTNSADTDAEVLTFFVTTTNTAAVGSDGDVLENTLSVDYDANPGTAYSDTAAVEIVEPTPKIEKTVTPETGGSDTVFTYTVVLSNTGTSPLFDAAIIDTLPAGMVAEPFASDGLDNDADGTIDEADEATAGFYDASPRTLTWNETTTGTSAFAAIAPNASITLQYAVTIDIDQLAATPLVNTAMATGASVPDGEPAYSATDDAQVTLLGTISNQLWYDLDNDNQYTASAQDLPLAGTTVELWSDLDVDGTLTLQTSATTDAAGTYMFEDLDVTVLSGGTHQNVAYEVRVPTLPTGYTSNHLAAATADNDAKDTSGYAIVLGPNSINDATADFGVIALGTISGTIWSDATPDTVLTNTTDDTPLAGYTVHLWADLDHDGVHETDLGTATTDANGEYSFGGLQIQNANAGVMSDISYSAVLDTALPTGTESLHTLHTAPNTADNNPKDPAGHSMTIPLTGTKENPTGDFGITLLGQVGGTLWFDYDMDGNYEPVTELPIVGATISLMADYGDGNGFVSAGMADQASGATGTYLFDALPLRWLDGTTVRDVTYQAIVTDSTVSTYASSHGMLPVNTNDNTAKNPDGYSFAIAATTDTNDASDTTGDFGFSAKGVIGNLVFYDFNNDGVFQSATEFGIPNVELTLAADYGDGNGYADPAGVTNPLPSASPSVLVTDAAGGYAFGGLPLEWYDNAVVQSILYQVAVTNNVPLAFVSTHTKPGGDNGDDTAHDPAGASTMLSITGDEANQIDNAIDFGYVPIGSVGSKVFYDYNYNGVFDLGTDAGMPGVTVALWADYNDGTGFVPVGSGPANAPAPAVTSLTSDASGNYLFTELPLSYTNDLSAITNITYQAQVDLASVPGGYTTTHTLHGNPTATGGTDNEGKDPAGYTFTLTQTADPVDQIDVRGDFGFSDVAELGDLVWYDVDRNGVHDSAYEAGIENVDVTLWADYDDGAGFVPAGSAPAGYPVPTSTAATTDATGFYTFGNLPLERYDGLTVHTIVYQVRLDTATVPDGRTSTHTQPNANNGNDTAHDPAEYTATLTLANDDDPAGDFGFGTIGQVGGTLWYDLSHDGAYNTGDLPMPGVGITLLADYGDGAGFIDPTTVTGQPGIANNTTTTNSTGEYSFDDLPLEWWDGGVQRAITYKPVTNGVPAGWTSNHTLSGTADEDAHDETNYAFAIAVSTDATDQIDTTGDFGFGALGAVGNQVFEDVNVNGTYDTGDLPIAGVSIDLWADTDHNGLFETFIGTQITDASGQYAFADLQLYNDASGTLTTIAYQAQVASGVPITLMTAEDIIGTSTTDNDAKQTAGHTVTMSATNPTNDTADFGYQLAGIIGNHVFFDEFFTGDYAPADDLHAAGIDVSLWADYDHNGVFETAIGTDTTGPLGSYFFPGLIVHNNPAGTVTNVTYQARVDMATAPLGYISTEIRHTSPTTADETSKPVGGYNVTLSATVPNNMTADFGLGQGGEVGTLVFYDWNNNGVFDGGPNEYGIDGITVELWYDADGDGTIETLWGTKTTGDNPDTTTTESGWYLFDGLPVVGATGGDAYYEMRVPTQPLLTAFGHTTGVPVTSNTDLTQDNNSQAETGQVIALRPDGIIGIGSDMTNYFLDFGYSGARACINGYTFHDQNADVQFDTVPADTPIEGTEMILWGMDDYGNIWGPDPALGATHALVHDWITTNMNPGNVLPYEHMGTQPTDADGFFEWKEVNPGTYHVIEVQPDGYVSIGSTAGTNLPVGQNGEGSIEFAIGLTRPTDILSEDSIENIILHEGQCSIENNFGNGLAAVSGTVFVDQNNDGAQDTTEPGIGGVGITLMLDLTNDGPTADDTVLAAQVLTDAAGDYAFDGVALDVVAYAVVTAPPAGYGSTHTEPGGSAGDATANTPDGYTFDVSQTQQIDPSGDFGYTATAFGTIGNQVFYDTNDNGTFDAGDTALFVQLQLLDATGTAVLDGSGTPVTTMTDPATGQYAFRNLAYGTYSVQVNDLYGLLGTFVSQHTVAGASTADDDAKSPAGDYSVTITSMAPTDTTADFGYIVAPELPPLAEGQLGDTVWFDANNNGVQDAGEPGISGVTISAVDAAGNTFTATTNGAGIYDLSALPYGTYTVTVTDTAGIVSGLGVTTASSHALTIDATTPSDLTGDFGYTNDGTGTPLGLIGNQVWYDAQPNGTFDPAGDMPLAGVTLEVIADTNGNGLADTTEALATASIVTDAMGQWSAMLPFGHYVVRVADDLGYAHTAGPATGADDNSQPAFGYAVLINNAQPVNTTADFGFVISTEPPTLGSIGDYVWFDTNNNGTPDAGEPPLPGVTVQVVDGFGTVHTAITDATGAYLIGGLPMGPYAINVIGGLPAGLLPSTAATINVALTETIPDTSIADFGYTIDPDGPLAGDELGTVGDTVWYDLTVNATQDTNEPGIGAVLIELVDSTGTVVATTMTDATGAYLFPLVAYGQYDVRVAAGQGLLSTMLSTHSVGGTAQDPDGFAITVDADTPNGTNADFAYRIDENNGGVVGFIGNQLFADTDGDGVFSAADSPLGGISVVLELNGSPFATTTTNASGTYSFGNLPTDDGTGSMAYTVQVPSQSALAGFAAITGPTTGQNNHSQNALGYAITLTPGAPSNMTADFGYENTVGVIGRVGDTVWHDANQNGVIDANESPLAGVELELLNSNGLVIATTTTDAAGAYIFDFLVPGDYTVRVNPLSAAIYGWYNSLGTDAQDPVGHSVSITQGEPDQLGADFGFYQTPAPGATGTVSGSVWTEDTCDPNSPHAGIYTLGRDTLLDGITMHLYLDITGNGLTTDDVHMATAVTDGTFAFVNLPLMQNYVVVVADGLPTSGHQIALGRHPTANDHGKPHDGYAIAPLSTLQLTNDTADFAIVHNSKCPSGVTAGPINGPSIPDTTNETTGGGSGGSGGGRGQGGTRDIAPTANTAADAATAANEDSITRELADEPPMPEPYMPISVETPGDVFVPAADDLQRATILPRTGISPELAEAFAVRSPFADADLNHRYYASALHLYHQRILRTAAQKSVHLESPVTPFRMAQWLTYAFGDNIRHGFDEGFSTARQYAAHDTNEVLRLGLSDNLIAHSDGYFVPKYALVMSLGSAMGIDTTAYRPDHSSVYEAVESELFALGVLTQETYDMSAHEPVLRGQALQAISRAVTLRDLATDAVPRASTISMPHVDITDLKLNTVQNISDASSWLPAITDGAGVYYDVRPDRRGHRIVFAHSSVFSFDTDTTIGSVFAPLIGGTNVGDRLKIDDETGTTHYEIVDIYQIAEDDVSAITDGDPTVDLTIFTCDTPPNVDMRWVYEAKTISHYE